MKLNAVQFLRGVAAVLVVYAHAIDVQMSFSVSRQQNFYFLQNFGAIGVDIFFAISGFIITFVANKYLGAEKAVDFFTKRFIRINPIYYIASLVYLAVIVLLAWFAKHPVQASAFIGSISDTIFIIPVSDGYSPILAIGWTLSFEWLFYTVFILLILFKVRNKPLALVIAFASLLLCGYLFKSNDYRFIFLTNPIILEFLFGVVICWLYFSVQVSKKVACLLVIAGIAGCLYSIFWGYGYISEAGYIQNGLLSAKRVLLWGIPSALLVAGCVFLEKGGALDILWNNRWGKLIGDASYSIYLIHLTIFSICSALYRTWGFFFNPDVSIFVHVALAVLAGTAFYMFVEKPLLRYLHNNFVKETLPVIPATG